MTVLFAFVVFAFVLLSWRTEINANETSQNAERILKTQQITCESSREILRKYNQQQDDLIAVELANQGVDPVTSAGRIKAYREGRIDPLPICEKP